MTNYLVVFKDPNRESVVVRDVSHIDYRAEPYYWLFYGDEGIDLADFRASEVEGVRPVGFPH